MPAVSLPLHGYHDQPVPNHFLRQKRDGQRLAIVLPGYGYTCDMPVLYYTVSHLIDQGADIMQVEYTYNQQPDYAALADDKRRQWLLADVLAAARAGLAQRDYQRVTVIGKSRGTRDACPPGQRRTPGAGRHHLVHPATQRTQRP